MGERRATFPARRGGGGPKRKDLEREGEKKSMISRESGSQ